MPAAAIAIPAPALVAATAAARSAARSAADRFGGGAAQPKAGAKQSARPAQVGMVGLDARADSVVELQVW